MNYGKDAFNVVHILSHASRTALCTSYYDEGHKGPPTCIECIGLLKHLVQFVRKPRP
jgi:hypothetical protein